MSRGDTLQQRIDATTRDLSRVNWLISQGAPGTCGKLYAHREFLSNRLARLHQIQDLLVARGRAATSAILTSLGKDSTPQLSEASPLLRAQETVAAEQLPVPVIELTDADDKAVHVLADEIECRARSIMSWAYGTHRRRTSRRYEGFQRVRVRA